MAAGTRLGLARTALHSAIAEELNERGLGTQAEAIASAVADAIDANNAEMMRQLRDALGLLQPPPAEATFPEAGR